MLVRGVGNSCVGLPACPFAACVVQWFMLFRASWWARAQPYVPYWLTGTRGNCTLPPGNLSSWPSVYGYIKGSLSRSLAGWLAACCVCDVPAAHKACGRKIMLPLQIQFREAAAPKLGALVSKTCLKQTYTRRVSPVESDSIICCALSLLTLFVDDCYGMKKTQGGFK